MTNNTSPRTLWHASRADIERPTLAGRTTGENHANSGLGLYCATRPEAYIANFGPFIHALTVKEDARVMRMTIQELAKLSGLHGGEFRSRDWFVEEGRRLSEAFDIIELVEHTGDAAQAIVLHDDAIIASRVMSAEDFARTEVVNTPAQRRPGF